MKIFVFFWKCQEVSESFWKTWKFLKISENFWIFMKFSENVWEFSENFMKISEIFRNFLKIFDIFWNFGSQSHPLHHWPRPFPLNTPYLPITIPSTLGQDEADSHFFTNERTDQPLDFLTTIPHLETSC